MIQFHVNPEPARRFADRWPVTTTNQGLFGMAVTVYDKDRARAQDRAYAAFNRMLGQGSTDRDFLAPSPVGEGATNA